MKNLVLVLLFLPAILRAQYVDNHVAPFGFEPNTQPVTHFAGDVNYEPVSFSSTTESAMGIASNGWIYVVASGTDINGTDMGFQLLRSIDAGMSFQTLFSLNLPVINYLQHLGLCVTGSDTTDYQVFISGYNTNTGIVFVEKFNANGVHSGSSAYSRSVPVPVKDVAICTDNGVQSVNTTGDFAICLAVIESGSLADSITYTYSADNGVTYSVSHAVYTTSNFIKLLDMDYASQPNYYNGRNYITWMETPGALDRKGNLLVMHNANDITGTFAAPFRLDTVGGSPELTGHVMNAKIAAAHDYSSDNTSLGLSVSIVLERAYNGNFQDRDIVTFNHTGGPSSESWVRNDILNSTSQAYSPDVAYDSLNNAFNYVYYDSTAGQFVYLTTGFNLNGVYAQLDTDFEDINPSVYPAVEIAVRADGKSAFIWKHSATEYRFDAEFLINTVSVEEPEISFGELITYPNPATEVIHIGVQLPQEQEVWFEVRSVTGTVVSAWNAGMLNAGETVLTFPCAELSNGLYVLVMQGKSGQTSRSFVVSR